MILNIFDSLFFTELIQLFNVPYIMPKSVEWKNANPIVRYSCSISFDELIRVNEEFVQNPLFTKMIYQIHDLTHIDGVEINDFQIDVISARNSIFTRWNKNLLLIIICNDPVLIERILLYKKYMKELSWTVELTEDVEKAILIAGKHQSQFV